MASALVNTVAISPPPPSPPSAETFPWLSPRISFSHDAAEPPPAAQLESSHPDASPEDFEFCLHDDPVAMLPADELFSEGKLVPLQLAAPRHAAEIETEPEPEPHSPADAGLPETLRKAEIVGIDPYAFSPRAPRCTARWRELLGLKRAARLAKPGVQVTAGAPSAAVGAAAAKSANARSSIKHLLHRHTKAASLDASLSLPLLRDSDHESPTTASRLSHSSSSSSSGPDHEDLARLSIDSDKPGHVPPRVRLARQRPAAGGSSRTGPGPARRAAEQTPPPRGVSVESPRMSSSGKIVFQGLERSSSSPGSFTGGPRPRARGVERSYSANVRVAPVLNVVPVCSLRGSGKPVSVFGLTHLFSPQQRKDREAHCSTRTESARSVRRQRNQDRNVSPKII